MTNEQIAKKIIERNRYMCLASASQDGRAWAAPVSYCFDTDLNFYFQTSIDSLHVENFRFNPEISVSIYDSTQRVEDIDGIQMSGIVGEVEPCNIKNVYDLFVAHVIPEEDRCRLAPSMKVFTRDGGTTLRFFQFTPSDIFKKDLSIMGVARRARVDLGKLRALHTK